MAMTPSIKIQIVRTLDDLPPESLDAVAKFVEFLRAQVTESPRPAHAPRRIVKLGGLWQGYSFSEQDIRAARREAWAKDSAFAAAPDVSIAW